MSRKLPKSLSEEEFNLLIQHTLKPHHKVAFLLGFASGLRVSEIVGLNKEYIDLKRKMILVRQGKGKKDRIVPLPKGFKPKMSKFIPLKCGVRSLQRAFKNSLKRANLKGGFTFHSLRYSFATQSLKRGIKINEVQLFMGHENLKTTSVYLKANPIEAIKSYEQFF
jgi:integrase